MGKQEFAEKVRRHVSTRLGSDCSVSLEEVRKNNGVMFLGLKIRCKNRNVFPLIYLESFLESYEEGTPMGQIVDQIQFLYEKGMPDNNLKMDFFQDFEQVKDRILYRLVNAAKNEKMLEEVPHIRFLDLAVCFYYSFYEKTLGIGSIMVYNTHVAAWKTNVEELMRLAAENTPRLCGLKVMRMDELFPELLEGTGGDDSPEGIPEEGLEPQAGVDPSVSFEILSNRQGVYGASAILYPGVLQGIAERYGGDVYLLPSSVHEMILLPAEREEDADAFRRMVCQVNEEVVSPEDVLSQNVYRYDSRQGRLLIIS